MKKSGSKHSDTSSEKPDSTPLQYPNIIRDDDKKHQDNH